MDANEYGLKVLAASRLADARQAADHQRLLDWIRDRDAPDRAAVGFLARAGRWLAGAGRACPPRPGRITIGTR
jgi:hypothetical protein